MISQLHLLQIVIVTLLCTPVVVNSQKLFLGANWKCSLQDISKVDELCNDLNAMWSALSPQEKDAVELCVHPPYVFIDRVRSKLNPEIVVGSQNVYDASGPNSPNTGAVTPQMLQSIGAQYVLLGHSDRRNNLKESDSLISSKVQESLSAGLGVVLTIGELPYQRKLGLVKYTLEKQLSVAMKGIEPHQWDKIVIAYEPVWAVGAGATPCTPEEAQRINDMLRSYITKHVNADAAKACRLTYTGSVNELNAPSYASLDDVDGFVVGRAGLNVEKLQSIIETLARDGHGVSSVCNDTAATSTCLEG